MIYEAAEDSFLLRKYVEKYSKGRVLDIGAGSGILMEVALKKTSKVEGGDIDEEAVQYCKKKGLNVVKGDLFSNVKGKFDLIVFNPPYLPEDEPFLKRNVHERKNLDLIGGKKGYELIERFFSEVGKYLEEDGKILIIFSSLTKKEKVDNIIKKNKFKFKLLEKEKYFFEELYAYLCY